MKMCSVIFEFLRADLQMDVGRTYITKPTDAVLKIFIANATRLVRIYMSHFKTVLKRLKRKLQTNAVQGVVIYFSKLSNYRIEVLFLFVPHSKYGGSCSTLHVASEVSWDAWRRAKQSKYLLWYRCVSEVLLPPQISITRPFWYVAPPDTADNAACRTWSKPLVSGQRKRETGQIACTLGPGGSTKQSYPSLTTSQGNRRNYTVPPPMTTNEPITCSSVW